MGKATTIGGVGSPGSGVQAPGTLTSVSATDEQTLRWVDKPTALHAVVSAVPAGVSRLPIDITFWIDKGDGKGDVWQGSDQMTSAGQTLYIGSESATNGGITVDAVHVPTTGVQYPPTDADQVWTLRAAAGKYLSTDAVPASAVSHSFTMHKSGAPSATGISSASAGPSTTMGPNADGAMYWSIPISFLTPGMVGANRNCRRYVYTVNITDVDGNEAPVDQGGGEVPVGSGDNDGSLFAPDPLVATFNPAGSIYTYARFYVYGIGLDAGDDWNSGTRTLQEWPGSLTYGAVNFGEPPDGRIPGTRIDPATLGPGVGKDPSTKKLLVKITGPLYADVAGNVNLALASDFTVLNGEVTQAAVDLAKAINFNTTNFTKTGGLLAINTLAVNQLIAGTALFAGDVVFARVGGGKVTINSAGVALGSDLGATPAASLTLTPNGATIAKGSNSLALDSTGLTASDASGNSLTLKTEGVRIVRGSTNMLLSATGMALTDANGNTLSMGAGGVLVSRGSSSVLVASDGVTIVNGVFTSPRIMVTGSGFTVTLNSINGLSVAGPNSAVATLTNGYLSCTYGSYTGTYSGTGFGVMIGTYAVSATVGFGQAQIAVLNGSAVSILAFGSLQVNGIAAINGVGQFIGSGGVFCPTAQVACSSLLVGANTAINSSNQFVGFGVNCPYYGVTAAGFNPYIGGTQYYGQSLDITILDSGGGYCKLNGAAARLSYKGGSFVGLI